MKAYRIPTKHIGVFERSSQERLHKGKPDICFDISYKLEGKRIFEKVGWLSEGYSAKFASDIRTERLRAIRHGDDLPKQKKKAPLFEEVASKYMTWAKGNKSRQGIDDRGRYANHLAERFDASRLDEISSFHLEKFKSDLTKEGLSPATVKHCLVLIRQIYNKAKVWGLYDGENPVKGVKMPAVKNQRERFLSYDEAALLLDELKRDLHRTKNPGPKKDPQLHDMALLSLHCGLRAGEICNLKGHDLDFMNGIISISDPKSSEPRKAFMTKAVKSMLETRKPNKPGEYIFRDRKSSGKIKAISQAFGHTVDRLELNAGVTDPRQMITFHSLRHTFASWLAMQGESLVVIRDLMGHKSFEMTKRYAHLIPDHKRQAAANLEKAFDVGKNVKSSGQKEGTVK